MLADLLIKHIDERGDLQARQQLLKRVLCHRFGADILQVVPSSIFCSDTSKRPKKSCFNARIGQMSTSTTTMTSHARRRESHRIRFVFEDWSELLAMYPNLRESRCCFRQFYRYSGGKGCRPLLSPLNQASRAPPSALRVTSCATSTNRKYSLGRYRSTATAGSRSPHMRSCDLQPSTDYLRVGITERRDRTTSRKPPLRFVCRRRYWKAASCPLSRSPLPRQSCPRRC